MEKHGNLPLGQALKLVISIIGQDAALAPVEEWRIPRLEKDLERMFKEEDISLARLKPAREDGALELVRRFFHVLESKYDVTKTVEKLVIASFFCTYRNALRSFTPYELETKDVALHLLNWSLGHFGLPMRDTETSEICIISKDKVLRLLDDTYEKVFNEIFEKLEILKTKFYEKIEKSYNDKRKKPLSDFEQAIKRDLNKSLKNNTNEPWKKDWKKFEAILDFVHSKGEKELTHRLIGLYLFKNAEEALEEICSIAKKDLYQIKQDIRLWAKDDLPPEPQSESQCFLKTAGKYPINDLSILQRDFIEPDFQEQRIAIIECRKYLWGNQRINREQVERLIHGIEEKCPHCSVFFATWVRARFAVLSCTFDRSAEDKKFQQQALEFYRKAFDSGRNFAGAYIKPFIEESIAASVYFDRRRIQDIPKVIDTDEALKVPVTDDTKQYYEYGYALNLFEQESTETYFLHFHAKEHFWMIFPAGLFIHKETAGKAYNDDILKAKGVYITEYDPDDPDGKDKWLVSIKHTKALRSVTEKNINRRMETQPGHNVQYTPLSFALLTRQLDIVEDYLKKFEKSLDVTIINTHGSTALLEAITQYRLIRFSGLDDEATKSNLKRYKAIILELIQRSPVDSLYAETVKKHISVLEEAINTFDIDIVQAIVEKKSFDIQKLKISADKLSPLYYAVNRMKIISDAIKNGHIDSTNYNIMLDKLDVPGIFPEDKRVYLENLVSDPLYAATQETSTYLFIGVPSVWEDEILDLREIVQYLIQKTDDVDAFVDKLNHNVLSLAAESDFDAICRLLIEKGADCARIFVENGEPFDTALFRAAWFKSEKTLEMLLTDYKERIGSVINERFGELKQTPAHLLFKIDNDIIYRYMINHDNFQFIEKFIPLFRNAGLILIFQMFLEKQFIIFYRTTRSVYKLMGEANKEKDDFRRAFELDPKFVRSQFAKNTQ